MARKRCDYCGKEVLLPFKCNLCGGLFCPEHRLPESHSCPELWRARVPKKRVVTTLDVKVPKPRRKLRYRPLRLRRLFSATELKHLLLSVILVTGVGISLAFPRIYMEPLTLFTLALTFALSFLLHELSHKFAARRAGLWAEFRISPTGALITLISIISPVKFISPGAVLVLGFSDIRVAGKVSLAGPTANIALSLLLSIPTYLMPHSSLRLILHTIALFNAYIALFNLIPFGSLDGLKVFLWSKAVWVAVFALSVILTIILYLG